MTTRIIAVVLALAVSALVASGHPAPQSQSIPPIDEPLARVRVRAADVAALNARLVAGGYDVLVADVERSTIDLAVTRA